MTDLSETFGEDFANAVSDKVQERRREREQLTDETKAAICDRVFNEGAISLSGEEVEAGDIMFTYNTDSGVEHDVLLMQLPDWENSSVWNRMNQLESGAVTLPMEFLGELMSCLFNDPEEAKKMEEGEWYLIVGNLDTWQPDEGEPRDQVSPVRGVISLEEAKEIANASLDSEGFGSATEAASDDEEDEEDESGDREGGIFGGDDDEEEEEKSDGEEPVIDATYSDIANVVEELAEQEPEVWESDRSHENWDDFIIVVCDKVDESYDDKTAREKVDELVLERIEEEQVGGEEDDDDEEDELFSA